ncbi:unnamed protein product [Nesidiocoris tenuis]|uniref:Uncharacterized protein n=1 Tax=Nesidiocoris tenuis TaxID=355587 RepID=A0A6H5GYN0_9HEMI|nr:unnamed protein product [Nesidiocoris tenuis]
MKSSAFKKVLTLGPRVSLANIPVKPLLLFDLSPQFQPIVAAAQGVPTEHVNTLPEDVLPHPQGQNPVLGQEDRSRSCRGQAKSHLTLLMRTWIRCVPLNPGSCPRTFHIPRVFHRTRLGEPICFDLRPFRAYNLAHLLSRYYEGNTGASLDWQYCARQ